MQQPAAAARKLSRTLTRWRGRWPQLICDSLGRGRGGSVVVQGRHLGLPVVAILMSACYEHAPRSGPLLALADSVAEANDGLKCRAISTEGLLPHQPPFHSCVLRSDTTVAMDIARNGRILSIRVFWPDDSVGRARAARTIDDVTARLGPPTFVGDDIHGHHVHQWATDSICAGLYQRSEGGTFQFARSTPDALGLDSCP